MSDNSADSENKGRAKGVSDGGARANAVKKAAPNFPAPEEVVLEHFEDNTRNIAKTDEHMEAESKLARNPDMQELVNRVLEEEKRGDDRTLSVARKKNKKDMEFARQLAFAERFDPDASKGLTAAQVETRKEKGLVNATTASNVRTYSSIFFKNIVTFFNLLCIVVAAALVYVGNISDLLFMLIMVINVVINIVLEIRSKRTIERLSLISAPVAVVIRDGVLTGIPTSEVVLDDIIFLENGKQIPADCIILTGEAEVNESMLTGESVPILKGKGKTLYGGSFITSGNCYARVDKIGSANYIESLAAFAKRYRRAKSEIMLSLRMLIMIIGIAVIPFAVIMYFKNNSVLSGSDMRLEGEELIKQVIPITAGSVIGMIPSGMFLLTSISLSLSVLKLGRHNVLVQDLYCIEMLARVNVLCLDKTGTITDGTMNVNEIIEFKNDGDVNLGDIVGSMMSATGDNNQTSVALIQQFGYSKALKPSVVMPFSSQRKFSAVTFENYGTVIMGAPEFIIRNMGVRMENIINEKAKQGLRILMVAFADGEIKGDKVPTERRALALITIEDHIRADAPATLNWFKENGVALKVISGDNPVTVSEVARRAGVDGAEKYVSLENMTDPEVVELANQYTVFGRVTPEQKRLLIKAIKAKGNSVAMTGDGVNDILALKEADCSVAIASGSEAARNVSHMVLMDSNFANMPSVVHEGRRVINNIQKSSSLFLMKTVFTILLSLLVFVIPGMYYPFRPSNLMPFEFFIIGLPSLGLAFQSNNNKVQGRFIFNILKNALPAGLTLLLCFLALFAINEGNNIDGNLLLAKTIPANGAALSEFSTAAMISITFSGSIMLFRVCLPPDFYRVAVWGLSTGICVAFCVFMTPILGLAGLNFNQYLLIIIIIESSYWLVSLMQMLLSKMKVG